MNFVKSLKVLQVQSVIQVLWRRQGTAALYSC